MHPGGAHAEEGVPRPEATPLSGGAARIEDGDMSAVRHLLFLGLELDRMNLRLYSSVFGRVIQSGEGYSGGDVDEGDMSAVRYPFSLSVSLVTADILIRRVPGFPVTEDACPQGGVRPFLLQYCRNWTE